MKHLKLMLVRSNRLQPLFYSILVLALFIVGGFLYAPAVSAPFQMDDVANIVNRAPLRYLTVFPIWDLDPLRFLTNYSFAINYYFTGLRVEAYRIVNVMFHVINAVFVFHFIFLLHQTPVLKNRWIFKKRAVLACFVSLLFLIHPVQTQAVNYIVQRATLLAALGYLGALVFYLRYRFRSHPLDYALACFAAFASIFTKQTTVTLIFTLMLSELFFFKDKWRGKWLLLLPFAGTFAFQMVYN